jgi:hypothetical protein
MNCFPSWFEVAKKPHSHRINSFSVNVCTTLKLMWLREAWRRKAPVGSFNTRDKSGAASGIHGYSLVK